MENKILIDRDERAIKDTKNLHNVAVVNLQKIADELKAIGVEPSYDLVISTVRFDGKSIDLENILKGMANEEIQKVPALEEIIQKKYSEHSKRIKDLGVRAYNSINHYTPTPFYDPNPVEFSRLCIENGKVSITPERLIEIEDECSVYVDSESRNQIFEKMQKVIESVKDLQESLNSAQKKGLDQYAKFYAVAPMNTSSLSILAVDHDGEVSINSKNFGFII
ncbi:hypothetical protein [Parabacteroides sp. PF5-9]|uniref:hypothetical protein n=1 Tax=Parabacteroides sp. PF5-9 TaxID=1742404 RepID=UPI002477287F|nr:hypothetical protein [Parabacteroides sp. PF5-9]MDH6357632.1 hypothetical protein [Parabacteroides sp. PF5-9]